MQPLGWRCPNLKMIVLYCVAVMPKYVSQSQLLSLLPYIHYKAIPCFPNIIKPHLKVNGFRNEPSSELNN